MLFNSLTRQNVSFTHILFIINEKNYRINKRWDGMYNILICENAREPMTEVALIAKEFFSKNDVDFSCNRISGDFEKELERFAKEHVNIYILNINLGEELNGLELAKRIRQADYLGYIIFVTSYTELALTALSCRIKMLDFIDKTDENFVFRLNACFETVLRESSAYRYNDKRIVIKTGTNHIPLYMNEINYIETDSIGRKIIIHALKRNIESGIPITRITDELDERFFRCHRGVIVNTDKILNISSERGNAYVELLNGEKCPLSLRRLKKLTEAVKGM